MAVPGGTTRINIVASTIAGNGAKAAAQSRCWRGESRAGHLNRLAEEVGELLES